MICLVRPIDGDANVLRLLLGEHGQLCVELFELQAGDLFIEVLGQGVNTDRIIRRAREKLDLGDGLVGEA